MPKKKVPCFTADGLPHERYPEFDRQLAGQETGINDMTVDEYLKGRDLFESKSAVRDPKVARRARADHQAALTNELYERFRAEGMSKSQALSESAKKASEAMKTLAALHSPDMVAAGKDVISGFGVVVSTHVLAHSGDSTNDWLDWIRLRTTCQKQFGAQ